MVTTPVFIVACPRSGTTKLASLLNKHSLVAAATETHFFNHVSKLSCFDIKGNLKLESDSLAKFFAEPRVLDFLAVSQLKQEDFAAALMAHGATELSRKQVFDTMMAALLKVKAKTVFCEKTPQHLQNLNEILVLYPEAKFIHLLRDGRDVVSSLIKMPWRPPGLINNARFWQRYIKLGEAAQRHIPLANLQTYKYEDLLLEPEATLKSICEFIGIEFEVALLGTSSAEPVFATWEAEWKHKASQDLDPSRIGAWREELDADSAAIVNCFLAPTIKRLGYTVSGERVHRLTIKRCIIIAVEYMLLALSRLLRLITPKNNILSLLLLSLLSLSYPVLAKPLKQALERGPYLQMTKQDSTIIRYRTKKPLVTILKYSEIDNGAELFSYSDDLLQTEHEVHIKGLKPDTRYIYSLHAYKNSKPVELGRGSYYLKTAPLAVDTTRVWVLGDSGTSASASFNKFHNAQIQVRDAFLNYLRNDGKDPQAGELDMILMLGDNTYWYGKDEEYTKGLFTPYAMQLSAAPVFSVLGNHDSGYQEDLRGYSARSCPSARGAYYDAFSLPANAELGGVASATEAYYSFDYGAAHYLMLDSYDSHEQKLDRDEDDTEPKLSPNNKMITWLKQDLEAFVHKYPEAKTRPWLIAVFHHAVHSSQAASPEAERNNFWKHWMETNVTPILEEYGTDLVFSGHIHRYERTKAFGKTTYVVLGCSGSSFGRRKDKLEDYFVISSDEMGSGLLEFSPVKLDFKFINNKAQLIDSFTLTK